MTSVSFASVSVYAHLTDHDCFLYRRRMPLPPFPPGGFPPPPGMSPLPAGSPAGPGASPAPYGFPPPGMGFPPPHLGSVTIHPFVCLARFNQRVTDPSSSRHVSLSLTANPPSPLPHQPKTSSHLPTRRSVSPSLLPPPAPLPQPEPSPSSRPPPPPPHPVSRPRGCTTPSRTSRPRSDGQSTRGTRTSRLRLRRV